MPKRGKPSQKVSLVLVCSICSTRRYFSKHVTINPPLKLYCPFCKTRTQFDELPITQWDAFAGNDPGGPHDRPTQPTRPSEPK